MNISVKLSPGRAIDDMCVDTGITFVKEKVKDSLEDTVSERQGTLHEMFDKDKDIKKVTLTGGGKTTTIFDREAEGS